MLDKLMDRVFGSYRTTITGLGLSALQYYLMNGGRAMTKEDWISVAIPVVMGATVTDRGK